MVRKMSLNIDKKAAANALNSSGMRKACQFYSDVVLWMFCPSAIAGVQSKLKYDDAVRFIDSEYDSEGNARILEAIEKCHRMSAEVVTLAGDSLVVKIKFYRNGQRHYFIEFAVSFTFAGQLRGSTQTIRL